MSARRVTAALIGASALVLSGCGGSSTSDQTSSAAVSTLPSFDGAQTTSTQPAGTERPTPSNAGVLPDLVVDDVGAQAKVNLASLTPAPEPILVWLWAPH